MTEAVRQLLTCPLCLNLATDAVVTDCCEQIGCQTCLKQLQTCPRCRARDFDITALPVIRKMVDIIPIACPNRCNRVMDRVELAAHLKSCENRRFFCSVDDYQFEGTIQELTAQLWELHLELTQTAGTNETECEFRRHEAQLQVSPQDIERTRRQVPTDDYNVNTVDVSMYHGEFAVRNAKGAFTKMGGNSKFYCAAQGTVPSVPAPWTGWSGLRRACGNGGNNCVDCMRLDIQLRNLPPGQLVNSNGHVTVSDPCRHLQSGSCVADLQQQQLLPLMCRNAVCGHDPVFYCGKYGAYNDYGEAGLCSASHAICPACKYITTVMAHCPEYYSSLWQ